jgi:hypothetical protein
MITRQQVIDAVCEEYGITQDELLKPDQRRPIVQARHVAAFVMHEAGWSWSVIADTFGWLYRPCHGAPDIQSPMELQSVRMHLGLIPGWPAVEMLRPNLEVISGLGPV